jgi:hypothetical protein
LGAGPEALSRNRVAWLIEVLLATRTNLEQVRIPPAGCASVPSTPASVGSIVKGAVDPETYRPINPIALSTFGR